MEIVNSSAADITVKDGRITSDCPVKYTLTADLLKITGLKGGSSYTVQNVDFSGSSMMINGVNIMGVVREKGLKGAIVMNNGKVSVGGEDVTHLIYPDRSSNEQEPNLDVLVQSPIEKIETSSSGSVTLRSDVAKKLKCKASSSSEIFIYTKETLDELKATASSSGQIKGRVGVKNATFTASSSAKISGFTIIENGDLTVSSCAKISCSARRTAKITKSKSSMGEIIVDRVATASEPKEEESPPTRKKMKVNNGVSSMKAKTIYMKF